jgi:hydrogenase nickel incorporation protein HypA/HybF
VGVRTSDGAAPMHELAITQSLVDAVTEHTKGAAVAVVYLRVGKLSGVVPDAMRFCFEMVTDGSPLEGARLEIEEPEGVGRCRACGSDFTLPDLILLCPCGSADVQLLSGRELSLKSVEVAEHV